MPDVQVSVLIPVKDEEATLATLVAEIGEAFATMPEVEYEVIFVDDGSVDTSWTVMQELAATNERVRALRLRRNFG
ncbi:MAG: glycosyltransferase, partial [Actinophytocola sp.]|uniref:glycosyltransferase n=1 Tax=Actinophytocola sp. TaxID=1872138 RepID=UPI003D6C5A9E